MAADAATVMARAVVAVSMAAKRHAQQVHLRLSLVCVMTALPHGVEVCTEVLEVYVLRSICFMLHTYPFGILPSRDAEKALHLN